MKDDTGAAIQHSRQQAPIESHRCQQIDVESFLPFLIREHPEAAIGSARTADAIYQDLDATPTP